MKREEREGEKEGDEEGKEKRRIDEERGERGR